MYLLPLRTQKLFIFKFRPLFLNKSSQLHVEYAILNKTFLCTIAMTRSILASLLFFIFPLFVLSTEWFLFLFFVRTIGLFLSPPLFDKLRFLLFLSNQAEMCGKTGKSRISIECYSHSKVFESKNEIFSFDLTELVLVELWHTHYSHIWKIKHFAFTPNRQSNFAEKFTFKYTLCRS